MKNKLYILIDKNLDPIYGAVQGAHAVAEWIIEHGQVELWPSGIRYHNIWNNEYLIFLQCDLNELIYKHLDLYEAHDKETVFQEPDLDYQTTAIAIHESDIYSDDLRRFIKKQKLLKMETK